MPFVFSSSYHIWEYLMGCTGSFSENKCDAASAESCADEYIIMSNDTGYDPAVRFWKDKGFAVRRFNVNFCKQAVQRKKKHQVSGSSRYSLQGR